MQVCSFGFVDTGANLTQQYLVGHGPRPTRNFAYVRRLLALLRRRIWFGTFELIPAACIAAVPLADSLQSGAIF